MQDIKSHISKYLDTNAIVHYCSTNKNTYHTCSQRDFWIPIFDYYQLPMPEGNHSAAEWIHIFESVKNVNETLELLVEYESLFIETTVNNDYNNFDKIVNDLHINITDSFMKVYKNILKVKGITIDKKKNEGYYGLGIVIEQGIMIEEGSSYRSFEVYDVVTFDQLRAFLYSSFYQKLLI